LTARRPPTIATTANAHSGPDRVRWIVEQGLALEYSLRSDSSDSLPPEIEATIEAGLPTRFHAFFPDHDFAHRNPRIAGEALDIHRTALDTIHGHGQPVVTVHIGLDPATPISPDRAVTNLAQLVEYGRRLGITVCLENLRRGPTSDPATLLAWATASGAMVTLDVGHAISCDHVRSDALQAADFPRLLAPRLRHVHIYEHETDRHYPPEDMALLGPVVDRLLETPADWWTIELEDQAEILQTRRLLLSYLETAPGTDR
jgi:sugar phosphate isomerase/epimerase